MLRADSAPVGFRGARVGSSCVERLVVNSPARVGRLQPPLGFRCALPSCSLFVPAPHLALHVRRESFTGASLRVRSRGERAAEAPQAGAPVTVWVKRTDMPDAQYVSVKGVDLQQTVDDFKARWVVEEELTVRPSLVTLRLVKRGAGKPTAKQEAKAKELDDPSLSLAEAKFTDTAWLLAVAAPALLAAERDKEAERQLAEREEEAERQRAERRARRDVKVLVVSFPGERSDETWKVGDQASLASLLRGGSLAPAATPSERLTSLKVLDSGAYTFMPPEAPLKAEAPLLHNVTLNFDLLVDGSQAPLFYADLSPTTLKETLRRFEAVGLAESKQSISPVCRAIISEFSSLRSDSTYWVVPAETDTLRDKVIDLQRHNGNLAKSFEHEASECLVKLLRESGHSKVERVCSIVLVPDGRGKMFEVDGVVLADKCAVVLEAKNRLSEVAGAQLQRTLKIIRTIKDSPDCPPELKIFAGKEVRGALAGNIIKPVDKAAFSSQELCEFWKQEGFTVLLPSGDGLGWQSSCHFTVA